MSSECNAEFSSHINAGWVYRDCVDKSAAGQTVLEFYSSHYRHSKRSAWRHRIETGAIRVDGETARCDGVVQRGQQLAYHRAPWREPESPCCYELVWEDDDVVVVDKPGGLQVVPGGEFLERTLLWLLRPRFGKDITPVHRLGRGTSGLVLCARTRRAKRSLALDLQRRRVGKTYRALIAGAPDCDSFRVDVPIGRVSYEPLGELFAARADGVESLSEVSVIERRPSNGHEARTLVAVNIPTGRPHQIRIHLAAAGFPLTGEPLYDVGGLPRATRPGERHPLPGDTGYHLHATKLRFAHPASGSPVVCYCAPPPILRARTECVPNHIAR